MRPWESFIPAEERRIFETAGFGVRQGFGRQPVLLVVDVVLSFTGSSARPVLEAIGEFETSCGSSAWETLPRIRHLIDAARAAGRPVVYTKGSVMQKTQCGDTVKSITDPVDIARIYGAPIHPEVAPQPGEFVLEKTKASAFFGTPLATYLNRMRADCVLICGTSTSGCVRATAVDAWSYGFPTFVVEEACFDRSRFFHLATLFDLNAKYATVVTLDEAVEHLRSLAGASEPLVPAKGAD
jgi:maleamate amidohydrolase